MFNNIKGKTCEIIFIKDMELFEIFYNSRENGPKQINNSILSTMIEQKKHNFYVYNNELAIVKEGEGPKVLSSKELLGILNDFVEINEALLNGFRKRHFSQNELTAVLKSPSLKNILPELKLYTRSPLFDTQWESQGKAG